MSLVNVQVPVCPTASAAVNSRQNATGSRSGFFVFVKLFTSLLSVPGP